MNLSNPIDVGISKSSLIGLRAELLKKQEEVKRIKEKQQDITSKEIVNKKASNVNSQKSKGEVKKQSRTENKFDEDDSETLKKSREVLEAKARLYDKLNKMGTGCEEKESQYLIDFNLKHKIDEQQNVSNSTQEDKEEEEFFEEGNEYSDSSDQSDEWVDYVDMLGRSRRCLRKDLPKMKEEDSSLAKYLEPPPPPPAAAEPSPELLSWDMQREMMRKKWEEEEALLMKKNDIHYQDVLFNEARAHGVGYFAFSSEEAERLRQQEALAKLRQETLEQQQAAQGLRARREQQLNKRLEAARKRRRERLGLPEPEPEPEALEDEKAVTEEEQDKEPEEEKLEDIKEAIKRIAPVRPWDIGKQTNDSVLSQEEWVEKKRQERPQEFAPPSCLLQKTDLKSSYKIHSRQEETKTFNPFKNTLNNKKIDSSYSNNNTKRPWVDTKAQTRSKPTLEDIDNLLSTEKEKYSKCNNDMESQTANVVELQTSVAERMYGGENNYNPNDLVQQRNQVVTDQRLFEGNESNSSYSNNYKKSFGADTKSQTKSKPTLEDIDKLLSSEKEKYSKCNSDTESQSVNVVKLHISASERKNGGESIYNTTRNDLVQQNNNVITGQRLFKGSKSIEKNSEESSEEHVLKTNASIYKKLKTNNQQTNVFNIDQLHSETEVYKTTQSFYNVDSSVSSKRKWAAIAPPPTMDYYAGNCHGKIPSNKTKMDMADSVSAGLDRLKSLSQEKDQKRIKGLLDIT